MAANNEVLSPPCLIFTQILYPSVPQSKRDSPNIKLEALLLACQSPWWDHPSVLPRALTFQQNWQQISRCGKQDSPKALAGLKTPSVSRQEIQWVKDRNFMLTKWSQQSKHQGTVWPAKNKTTQHKDCCKQTNHAHKSSDPNFSGAASLTSPSKARF